MDVKEMKKNAEFLIDNMKGKDIPGSTKINIRYRNVVNFAKIYGITNPKYVGTEELGVIACHAFANYYTIKAIYKLLIGIKLNKNGKERGIIIDPGKLLHAGNRYNWEGCVDVKPGDRLTVTGKCTNIWLVEKNMILFADFLVHVKNQNNESVCNITISAGFRKGGY
ncbi:MAG: MaoC family dehydratase N-terminal domain-containing protein [Promethearchaeota archaeon]